MPHYLVQVSYTPDAWAAQLQNPRDRRAIVQPLFDQLGGRIESVYYAFGPYDVVCIAELPDNRRAAALSLTLTASGAIRAIQTTPLLPIEEGIEAMRYAADIGASYTPPLTAAQLEAFRAKLAVFEEGP